MRTKTKEITNTEEYIDSRDIIERIKALEGDLLEDYEKDELANLRALTEEAEGYSEWAFGVTLIREDCFEDYAREFAQDIGAISNDVDWPNTCIDWEWAARELRIDYTEVNFDGVGYLFR